MRRGGEDGTTPDGWQAVRLGDVCAPPEYGANAAALPFNPDLPRFVRITDITDEGRLRPSDARSADPAKVLGYELGPGDLLFARSGSVGRTYLYRSEDGPCVFAGYLIRFQPKPEVVLPRFVDILTHSDSYHRWVTSMLRVGAQPNINATEYSSLPILLPPLPEQRRIAAVLNAIDDAIELTADVIAATERLRDALLHDLLSHGVPGWHSEWRDVPGLGTTPADWEVVQLGEVAEVNREEWVPTKGASIWYLDLTAVSAPGRLSPPKELAAEAAPSRARRRVQIGDVLVSTVRPYLRGFARVQDAPRNLIASTGFAVLSPRPSVNGSLVYHHVMAPPFVHHLEACMTGQAYPAVRPRDVASYLLGLPTLAEQEAIVNLLDSVDKAIKLARDEWDGLQTLKASATDALLSGRMRLRS